jgi:hypothetical protein
MPGRGMVARASRVLERVRRRARAHARAAGDYIYGYVERIEQCGNRIVDMGGGTIADARADGSEENGVHDVSAFDFETPIHVRRASRRACSCCGAREPPVSTSR